MKTEHLQEHRLPSASRSPGAIPCVKFQKGVARDISRCSCDTDPTQRRQVNKQCPAVCERRRMGQQESGVPANSVTPPFSKAYQQAVAKKTGCSTYSYSQEDFFNPYANHNAQLNADPAVFTFEPSNAWQGGEHDLVDGPVPWSQL